MGINSGWGEVNDEAPCYEMIVFFSHIANLCHSKMESGNFITLW